jgi:chaperonin GroES
MALPRQTTSRDSLSRPVEEIKMKVKPLGDRVVVRRFEAEEKTAGGIVLPDTAKNKPQKGTVLATGPGRLLKDGTRRGLQVKEGDTVLFTSWAGDEFREGNRKDVILLMREEDILAVVDK